MIDVSSLTFAYSGHPPVFENFTWRVERGEAWSIIGPSGCGKSTLLYLLAGLSRPTAGTVVIDGEPISRPRPRSGLVLQDHGLLPWATVRENAWLGLRIRKFYGPDNRHAPADARVDDPDAGRRVDTWLRRLGIWELRDQFPSQLSRGQRQRTAIARTLVLEPDLLFLDEPFSALDAPTREDLQQLMAELHTETGLTRIIVTHDIEEAVLLGGKILAMEGRGKGGARIIENRCMGPEAVRNPDGFQRQCGELRSLLGSLM